MNLIGLEYGKWLSGYNWDYIATIRRHFKLTEFNTNNMMKRLIKHRSIHRLFYALEPDQNDNHTHVHLMIRTSGKYTRKRLANELGINTKAVSFIDEVEDSKSVSYYCTKHIKKPFSHHDFLY